ncbi:MAG: hypothetical protein V2A65_11575 [Candidatus Omnitrophota bacterium]
MGKIRRDLLFFLAFTLIGRSLVFAEDVTVRVKGESAINKQTALHKALQNAVEQGIGTYLDSSQKILNSELIEDRILKRTQGFIKSYEELSGGEENNTCWVMVKAVVSQDKVLDELTALQILFTIKGKPRLMVLADTRHLKEDYTSFLQDKINEKFLEKGFLCIDPERISLARHKERVKQALAGNLEAVKAIGLEEKADVVIVASAYKEEIGEVEGARPYRVNISGKAVWVDTGKIIASASNADADPFGRATEAIGKAVLGLSDKLAGRIIEKWNDEIINTGLIEVLITGLDYSRFIGFQDRLQEITGVRNLYERSYEDFSKTGRLEVDSEFSSQVLAQALTTIKGFQVTIKSRQANKIECAVR